MIKQLVVLAFALAGLTACGSNPGKGQGNGHNKDNGGSDNPGGSK